MDHAELIAAARAAHKVKPVASIWHPDPGADHIDLSNGVMARVLTGNPAFQHTDGEIVAF